jgi:diguanylate cyclase (GGDEF)-like protein/PAS domain S-box-containing protein
VRNIAASVNSSAVERRFNGDAQSRDLPRAARRSRLIASAFIIYAAVFTLLAFSGWEPAAVRRNVLNGALIPVALMVIVALWAAMRAPHSDPRTRRGWQMLLAANVARLASVVAGILLRVFIATPPSVAIDDALALMFFPLCFIAMLNFVSPPASSVARIHYLLDATIVLLGSIMTVWYVMGQPIGTGAAWWLDHAVELAYRVGDVMLVMGVFTLLFYAVHSSVRAALTPIAVSAMLLLTGDVLNVWVDQHGAFVPNESLHSLYLWAWLLLGFAAWRYRTAEPTAQPPAYSQHIATLLTAGLPYAAVLGAHGLLFMAVARGDRFDTLLLLVCASTMTMIVIARQYLATRENRLLMQQTLDMANTLRGKDARFRALVQHATDIILVIDANGMLRYVTPSVERLMGYAPDALEGRRLHDLMHRDDDATAAEFIANCLRQPGQPTAVELRYQHADGNWRSFEAIGSNLIDDPDVAGIVINARDVTDRKQLEGQLRHRALHDPLTGLPNRTLFNDRLHQAWARAARRDEPIALLYLDLDRFKSVNDTFGHSVGDHLLVTVARRMSECLRTTDTVARLGGDEFAVILDPVFGTQEALSIAQRIVDYVRQPMDIQGHEIRITPSIGAALTTGSAIEPDHLLRRADAAMYQAKTRGRGRVEVFDPAALPDALTSIELEHDLRSAIEHHELEIVYQPIVEFSTGRMLGVEALIRWNHPTRGLIGPSQFIPASEESGNIGVIGRFVLLESCRQLRRLQQLFPDTAPDFVSVNISPHQISAPDILIDIADALETSGLLPQHISVEVTEHEAIGNIDVAVPILRELREIGVRVAVDDFGVG